MVLHSKAMREVAVSWMGALNFIQKYCGSAGFHRAHVWSDSWGTYECPGLDGRPR